MQAVEVYDHRARVWEQVRYLMLQPRDTPEKKAARQARCLRRQAEILRRYYRASPQYTEQIFLERYARKHLTTLLEQREEILKHAQKLLRRRALVNHLESHAPELLAWVTWQVTALELAERGEVEVQPSPDSQPSPLPRQKLTPEEREAKVEQYRARMLERERVQAQDYMARVKQKLDLRNKFRADLEQSGLDQDEVQMLEQEFLEKLFNEETTNGTATKETL